MSLRIREAAAQYSRVLVVTGGFHVLGLLHGPDRPPEHKKLPEKAQAVYPMRYTMPAADALSGYASGMPSPGFYAGVWAALHDEAPEQVWDRVVLDYLVRTGRALRSDGAAVSAYDEICALRQARDMESARHHQNFRVLLRRFPDTECHMGLPGQTAVLSQFLFRCVLPGEEAVGVHLIDKSLVRLEKAGGLKIFLPKLLEAAQAGLFAQQPLEAVGG